MPKVQKVVVSRSTDSIYFKIGEDTYVGFNLSWMHPSDIQMALEALEGGRQFLTSTTDQMFEHTEGKFVDITDQVLAVGEG